MSGATWLTKEACAHLRTEIQDLGYGQAERESQELFQRRFYPVPEHLRALDPGVVLVVGPRGAGKSELFQAFFSDAPELRKAVRSRAPKPAASNLDVERAAWRRGYPAGTDFPDSRALAKQITTEEAAKDLWYAMLGRCLGDDLEAGHRKSLQSLLDPMAADLGPLLRALTGLGAQPTAALDALEKRLTDENRWIFVGYDELDTLGGFDWSLMARLVRGLVAFWSDYGRRWRRIRAKVFLRSDLFRRHAGMGTADFAKLAANRAELAWSDAAVLGMLVKRIANTSEHLLEYCKRSKIRFVEEDELGFVPRVEKPEDAHPLLERLAGEHMGAGKKKGYVRNWVLDHLRDGNGRIAPRTIVRLFEQAAAKAAANQGVRPPRLIQPTALRQALDDVSTDHVTQGRTSEWPWLHGVEQRLRKRPLVPWRREEILDLLRVDWTDSWSAPGVTAVRPPEDGPDELLLYLVELGILRERSDGRIDAPDLYLHGLGLRRKGGVKAGRKKAARRRR